MSSEVFPFSPGPAALNQAAVVAALVLLAGGDGGGVGGNFVQITNTPTKFALDFLAIYCSSANFKSAVLTRGPSSAPDITVRKCAVASAVTVSAGQGANSAAFNTAVFDKDALPFDATNATTSAATF